MPLKSVPENYLDSPVESLPQIAARRLSYLHKLGIHTVYDALTFYPRTYENWSRILRIDDLKDKEEASFIAVVRQKPALQRKGRLSIIRAVLSDGSGTIRAVWFNQPYLLNRLIKNESYFFRGKIRRDGRNFDVTNPSVESGETDGALLIRPYYPLTKGLTQGVLRNLIKDALPKALPCLREVLPDFVLREEDLTGIEIAYEQIHRPTSEEELDRARKRLIYEELFLIQGGLRWMKRSRLRDRGAHAVCLDDDRMKTLRSALLRLGFSLTDDQKKVLGEVLSDMKKAVPMNRLVQGDVGSGKTVIALAAMLAAALAGYQSVFMAPTSILADQHYRTVTRFLEGTGIKPYLLLGSTPVAEKNQIRRMLRSGELLVLVGTHAVLSDKIDYKALALTVTDEQHRFGVRQRSLFADGNTVSPHTLVMSATPIPRTLALILYGDLDISVIRKIPSGRIPVETYTALPAETDRVYNIVRRQVEAGRQVYFVCPVIEAAGEEYPVVNPDAASASDLDSNSDSDVDANAEADIAGLISAEDLFAHLSQEIFKDLSVGLLHGGMKAPQKEDVMNRFLAGEIKILVSTTVVEVGVDNPNASVMVIENADRYGLSQLHQLRGRIGRGKYRSVCILISDKTEGLASKRLKTLCRTADGFEIARKDLELRGPGDFFGTRQHGIPELRIANLYRDTDVLERVGKTLDRIWEEDPDLSSETNKNLIYAFSQRFGSEINHPSL